MKETGVPGENHWPAASHWQVENFVNSDLLTYRTVSKSNKKKKNVETGKSVPLTHLHMTANFPELLQELQ